MTTYQIEYIGWRHFPEQGGWFASHPDARGKSVTYRFKVTFNEERLFLQVGITPSVATLFNKWASLEEIDHVKVAAKAVECYLASTIPPDHLFENHVIQVDQYWYPGYGGPPELREDYQSFSVKVEKPKPPLGFIKN